MDERRLSSVCGVAFLTKFKLNLKKILKLKAHRLTTIRNANIIYALDKGQLVKFGSHDELVKKEGIYDVPVVAKQGSDENDPKSKRCKLG